MNYVVITRDKCQAIGLDAAHRMSKGDNVVITDKELLFSVAEGETLDEKVKNCDGMLMTIDEVKLWHGKEVDYE